MLLPESNRLVIAPVPAVPATPAGSAGDTFGGQKLLLVKQEFDLKDACGIEAKNRYRISVPCDFANSQEGNVLLFGQEQSEGCERVCCSPCRSFTMNVHVGTSKQGDVALSVVKEHCHRMALPWPFMLHPLLTIPCGVWAMLAESAKYLVKDSAGTVIGEIVSPATSVFCCNAMQLISDAHGQEVMRMGPSSQCNSCCPCLADEVIAVFKGSAQVATITRNTLTCAELCGKTNRFTVDFGSLTELNERRLVFAAAMSFDMQFWEFK